MVHLHLVRKFGIASILAMLIGLSGLATAQQDANVGQMVSGLVTVNVGSVQADIDVGDVTVVNVEDVLNDSDIRILNNVLNNNEVASRNRNVLNDLLRDADIITDNQVVVGVLSGGIVVQDL